MRVKTVMKLFALATVLFFTIQTKAQNPENWTSKQLMEPAELANEISANEDLPVIICVGPSAIIPHSVATGMASKPEGLDKLKEELNTLPKDKKIVIYCGCCPFEHCPNVRPAINALKEMKFTNYYLLDLPDNIRKDWIDKDYPVEKS